MNNYAKRVSGSVWILLMICAVAVNSFAQYQPGDKVDDFTLQDTDGEPVNLYDFSGKVILLNFFATW